MISLYTGALPPGRYLGLSAGSADSGAGRHCRGSSSGPHPLDAGSTPSRDNHLCPQTLPSVPWGRSHPS